MGQFLEEYSKMQQALQKSHESETRFVNKCRELASGIQACQEKQAAYDGIAEENKKKIESLKRVRA